MGLSKNSCWECALLTSAFLVELALKTLHYIGVFDGEVYMKKFCLLKRVACQMGTFYVKVY